MVRRAIVWAGLPDPLLTQKILKKADPERGELESVLTELHRVFTTAWFTASGAIRKAQGEHDEFGNPLACADQGLNDAAVSPQGRPNAKSFGRSLAGRVGRLAGGLRLKTGRDTHRKVGAFCVEALMKTTKFFPVALGNPAYPAHPATHRKVQSTCLAGFACFAGFSAAVRENFAARVHVGEVPT